jgi:predicted aspartyl protease
MLPGGGFASGKGRLSTMPALIDTGAGRTVVTPEAARKAELTKINETKIAHAGGLINADVFVASIHFPKINLTTIEVVEVACCELPNQPIQCLIGRDIIARWIFTYNGPSYEWEIKEERAATTWVTIPED